MFSFGTGDSGVPWTWQAAKSRPGIDFLSDLSDVGAAQIVERVARAKQPGDIVVASIHWGSNWGYEVPAEHIRFAHRLVEGGVDVIHGHSSHHPRPIEVWDGKLVLYGCGDFINDYEGISGYEQLRDDLALMYFPELDAASGDLAHLEMVPCRSRRCGCSLPRPTTRVGSRGGCPASASRWAHQSCPRRLAALCVSRARTRQSRAAQ